MPVPRRRHSKSRTNKRRSHHALSKPTLINCPSCGEPTLPHRACPSCGEYKNNKVIEEKE